MVRYPLHPVTGASVSVEVAGQSWWDLFRGWRSFSGDLGEGRMDVSKLERLDVSVLCGGRKEASWR